MNQTLASQRSQNGNQDTKVKEEVVFHRTKSDQLVNVNTPPNQKKSTLIHRITRMFSNGARRTIAEEEHSREDTSENGLDGSASTKTRYPLSRQAPYTGRNAIPEVARRPSLLGGKKECKASDRAHKTFEVLEDGSHAHLLKSAKRREKMSDVFRDIFGVKEKDKRSSYDDQQQSFMLMWGDQRENERDQLALDKKGGRDVTAAMLEKYGKCHEVVGRGAFGVVSISHRTDPQYPKIEQLYAVKKFHRRPRDTPKRFQKRLMSEYCIASPLRHPNVISTLDLLKDEKGDHCVVMEFCAGGDLQSLSHATGKLEVAESDCYFNQLIRGVEYMHEMGVAHRDLKPENLLLTKHGALKITDFGSGECFRMAWEKGAHMTAGLRGSAPYIAPEEYVEKEFDPRAGDVWATGIIYMAMRTGRRMWRIAKKGEDEDFKDYLKGRRDEGGYGPIEALHRVSCSTRATQSKYC